MKPIFSSLGSNYTFTDVILSLLGVVQSRFSPGSLSEKFSQMKVFFDSTFKGETYFFYKGRDAIECALRAYSIGAGDGVLTQAFSCYAVEEAICRTGAVPVYVDIASSSANFSVETLRVAHTQSTIPIKAVIIQYSLGSVPDTAAIISWCKKHKIVVIEDVAQGYGGSTVEDEHVGTLGDVTCFSFGRDKILDAVTGGACCFRTLSHTQSKEIAAWYAKLHVTASTAALVSDHLYPLLTWCARSTFTWGVGFLTLGKVLLFLSKKVGLLHSPLFVSTTKASLLPHSFVPLLIHRLAHVDTQLEHRHQIALEYHKAFGNSAVSLSEDELLPGSLLRYLIVVKNPDEITKKVKKSHIFITDRWYRQAVDCSTLDCRSMYKAGSCENAERLAAHSITLPTHRGISLEDARRIITALQVAHQ